MMLGGYSPDPRRIETCMIDWYSLERKVDGMRHWELGTGWTGGYGVNQVWEGHRVKRHRGKL